MDIITELKKQASDCDSYYDCEGSVNNLLDDVMFTTTGVVYYYNSDKEHKIVMHLGNDRYSTYICSLENIILRVITTGVTLTFLDDRNKQCHLYILKPYHTKPLAFFDNKLWFIEDKPSSDTIKVADLHGKTYYVKRVTSSKNKQMESLLIRLI